MNINSPIVSVIIPAYNAEKYIAEAIESILNQTFRDFELIIFSDGCTDQTVSVIERYVDNRIILLKSDVNRGIVYGLNSCIEIARGKYIAALDSDDLSYPDRLQKQVDYLNMHKNVALVGTHINEKRDGIIYERVFTPIRTSNQIRFELLFQNGTIAHSSFMMRKEVLEKYNIKYEIFKQVQDYHMMTRISRYGDLACLEETLVTYRIHVQQSTNIRSTRMKTDEFDRARCMYIESLPLLDEDKLILKKSACRELNEKKDYVQFHHAFEAYMDMCKLSKDNKEDVKCCQFVLRNELVNQRHNWNLLKYYLLSDYKDINWLHTRLGVEFIIKCIIGYNKKWYKSTVNYMGSD